MTDKLPEVSTPFLLDCIFKLHLRIQTLEARVVELLEHRHDDWGRIFASDGVMCRYLSSPANLSELRTYSTGLDSSPFPALP
jgi:hypothetical protein